MSGHSPIESLRRLSPVSDAEAAAVFGAGREALLAELTAQPLGRRQRTSQTRRSRRPLVLALAVVAAAVTAAGAWAVLRGSPAHETSSVECVIRGVDSIIPSTSGDPAHDCTVEWKRELGTAAPPLRAYDNGRGGVTVIPRSQKPQAGWKRLVSGQDVDLIQLQNSLDDFVNGLNSSCFTSTAAASLTQRKLAQFGFTGWTITKRTPDSGGPAPPPPTGTKKAPAVTSDRSNCWSTGLVDPSTETVTLIAGSDQNGGTPTALADRLRPLTRACLSLSAAVASVRSKAGDLGLSESARGYDLNAVTDNSMRCASIYETVGGTIFLTVRGPRN